LFILQAAQDDDEDDDEDEEEEERDETPTRHAVVMNALDQVRGKAETVYEPFVLQKEDKVYIIFWKCEGFRVLVTGMDMGIEVEVQVTPPTDGQLESMGLERPSVPLRTLKSKFRVGFDFKVLPDSVKGEAKPPFIVFSMKKYVGIGGQVVIQ